MWSPSQVNNHISKGDNHISQKGRPQGCAPTVTKIIILQKDYFIIIALGSILFLPFLGGAHLFDWDEINFAECAREMLATGNYLQVQIDFEPFWEKPPLFIWMQAGAMHLFGTNEFAARFPNAICGIITLLFLFFIGKKLHSRVFGWWWVMAYMGSILPHLYFRSGIIDPWFNLFIFSSLCFFVLNFTKQGNFGQVKNKESNIEGLTSSQTLKRKTLKITFGGALLGLAVLTKGPVAILIAALTFFVYWALTKFKLFFSIPQIIIYIFFALITTSLWFGAEILSNGTWFIQTFITYQIRLFSTPDAGHGGFFGYHFVVLLLGCFPASIFALPSFWKNTTTTPLQQDFRKWMLILFWVVLILFSIVQSKIVHYSSLCYFPLTYLAALYLEDVFQREKKLDKGIVFGLLGIGGLISLIFMALPFIGKNIDWLVPFFQQDAFALGNLEAEVKWDYWNMIPGVILLLGLITFYFKSLINKESIRSITILFATTTLFITLSLYFIINKIEGYSQNAAIEFYKSLEGKDAYVKNVGFKSYAPLFYTKKPSGQQKESKQLHWLLSDKTDKDVYFVTRIQDQNRFQKHPSIKEINRKNGFVFFLKKNTIKD